MFTAKFDPKIHIDLSECNSITETNLLCSEFTDCDFFETYETNEQVYLECDAFIDNAISKDIQETFERLSNQKKRRCNNGPECIYFKKGICRYAH